MVYGVVIQINCWYHEHFFLMIIKLSTYSCFEIAQLHLELKEMNESLFKAIMIFLFDIRGIANLYWVAEGIYTYLVCKLCSDEIKNA